MAEKQNGATTGNAAGRGISQMEAVRRAMSKMGNDATSEAIQKYVKQFYRLTMSRERITNYKSDIRKKQREAAQAGSSAPSAVVPAAAAPAKPVPQTSAVKKTSAPKPAAPPAKQASAGGRNGNLISVDDLQTLKGLVGRVGGDALKTLIDVLST